MKIEINNQTKNNISLELVESVTRKFLLFYKKKKAEVSIAFVTDKKMSELNKTYRGADKPTDVLSFDGENNFMGEIIIDYAQIKRQAKLYDKSIQDELVFILVHGLLHLMGYNDDTEKKRKAMIKLGEEFIMKFNF